MCGATGAEKSAQQNEANISNQLNTAFGTAFGTNSSIMKTISGVMTPIVSAGPNQRGFSPEETAAETANIQDQGAANIANTANVVNEKMAQTGQANPSAVAGVDAGIAQRGEQQTAENQESFDVADAQQGNKNFFEASSALPAEEATIEGATGAAGGAATSAASTAMTGAQDVQQANDAWMAPVGGLIGGLGGAAIGKIP